MSKLIGEITFLRTINRNAMRFNYVSPFCQPVGILQSHLSHSGIKVLIYWITVYLMYQFTITAIQYLDTDWYS